MIIAILKNVLSFSLNTRLVNIRHSPSEPALHQRSQSTSRSSSLSRNRPDLTAPIAFKAKMANSNNIISPVTSNFALGLQDYAPSSLDRSTGLDLEDFLPVNLFNLFFH